MSRQSIMIWSETHILHKWTTITRTRTSRSRRHHTIRSYKRAPFPQSFYYKECRILVQHFICINTDEVLFAKTNCRYLYEYVAFSWSNVVNSSLKPWVLSTILVNPKRNRICEQIKHTRFDRIYIVMRLSIQYSNVNSIRVYGSRFAFLTFDKMPTHTSTYLQLNRLWKGTLLTVAFTFVRIFNHI